MYLLAPFIPQNVKKILRANPEFGGCAIFETKMAHLPLTKMFGTNHYYYFHLHIDPFHWEKSLKNSSIGSIVLKMLNFLVQNGHFPY